MMMSTTTRAFAVGALTLGVLGVIAGAAVAIDWSAVGQWAVPRALPLGLAAGGGLLLLAGVWMLRRGLRPRSASRPPLSWWVVMAAAAVVIAVTWAVTRWLFIEANTAKDIGAARIDAIKTGLAIGAGTTGTFALLLAVRRQWHSEVDAAEKNTTELYTKAADQLGSDKAPVRLSGLYALERLAQNNPSQRQTIVSVLCAYLRMPFILPSDAADIDHEELRARAEEREVRLTAQRVLAKHLQTSDASTSWQDIDLDLNGATLVNFDMTGCRIRNLSCERTRFVGTTWFHRAQVSENAWFVHATFEDDVRFDEATFLGQSNFADVTFCARAWFFETAFCNTTYFNATKFSGETTFDDAVFRTERPDVLGELPTWKPGAARARARGLAD